MSKNEQIRQTLAETRARRENQLCRVFKLKIDESSLKPAQLEAIRMQFVEAKWLVNEIIHWSSLSDDNKIWEYELRDDVVHLDKERNKIISKFCYLGAQQRQQVLRDLVSNVKTLSSLKKNGYRVGKLGFRSEVRSIGFKQYGISHKIVSKRKFKIAKIPEPVRVHGIEQLLNSRGSLRKDIELANARLLNTPRGYYIALTTFTKKPRRKTQDTNIGVDLGCSTTVTLSNREKHSVTVRESDRLKRLQRKLAKRKIKSKNRDKTRRLLRVEYAKMSDKKDDLANKLVNHIVSLGNVYMQDDNIHGWKVMHGKTVHHSVLGRLKTKLARKAEYVLDRFEATTKTCRHCGKTNELTLRDRIYTCDCGAAQEDRDVHAAKNMIRLGMIRQGLPEFKPVETTVLSSTNREGSSQLGSSWIGPRAVKMLDPSVKH